MRVTRKIIAARCNQLQAQLDAQNNPGRIKLKASLAEAVKTIDRLEKAVLSNNQAMAELTAKNMELKEELKNATALS